jgi:Undecaprenyl-phosphate glucose phosphotransferase
MSLVCEARVKISRPGVASPRRWFAVPVSYQAIPLVAAIIEVAWVLAGSITTGIAYHLIVFGNSGDVGKYIGSGIAVAALFSTAVHAAGLYRPSNLMRIGWSVRKVVIMWTVIFFCLSTVAFTLKIGDVFSRGAVVLFFIVGLCGVGGLRMGFAWALRHGTALGALIHTKLVIISDADPSRQDELIASLERYGYAVSCIFSISPASSKINEMSDDVRGVIRDVAHYVRQESIDEVIVAVPWTRQALISAIVAELRVLPTPVKLVPDPIVSRFLERPIFELGATKAVELQRAPLSMPQRALKHAIDEVVATLGLLVLMPMFVVLSSAIKLESPGPSFFRQSRVGFNGRPFGIWKFRTMYTLDDGPIVVQATRNDRRVTHLGRLLRRLSIDELPQLVNVLHGEMSLVGPRPHALSHDTAFDQLIATYATRHKIRPGITGWAQINGYRGETPEIMSIQGRVEHDLWYIEYWSLWLDLRILVTTLFQLLKPRNVY